MATIGECSATNNSKFKSIMNKVVNINLGGVQFTMDDIAYDHLSQYLLTLKKHFSASEGCDEIMSDIEARLAELFQEQLNGRSIVTVKDVEASILVMGKPEDFGADSIDENEAKSKSKQNSSIKTGKKLYRDDSNKVIGGVCSGIAAYFGIEDPLWVRLAFVVLSFTGFAIPLYFILMILVPKAETSADFLAMKGEPINVSNIAKTIETEIDRLSNKISGFDGSSDDKKKGFTGSQARQAIESGMSAFGGAIQYTIHFFGKIFRPFVYIIGVLLTICLCLIWVSLFYGFWNYGTAFYSIFDTKGHTLLALLNGFVLIGIPLVSLIIMVFQSVRRFKLKPYIWASMWSFWAINFISAAFLGASVGKSFSSNYVAKQSNSVTNLDTLYIEKEIINTGYQYFGEFSYNEAGNIQSNNVRLNVEKSKGKDFELIQEKSANGGTESEASEITKAIQWNYKLNNNKLIVPNSILLPQNQKFRNQEVVLTLKVPVGKYIYLGNTRGLLREIEIDEEKDYPNEYEEQLWQMTENGLVCPSFIKLNNYEMSIDVFGSSKIQIDGDMEVVLTRGDKFSIKAIGNKELVDNNLNVVNTNNLLMVSYKNNDDDKSIKLEIILPSLEKLDVTNVHSVELTGFSQKKLELNASGDFKINAMMEVENLIVDIEESSLKLKGTGNNLEITIDENGSIDAKNYSVKNAKLDNKDYGEVSLNVSDKLNIEGDDSNVNVKGSPEIIKKKEE